jgi:hypothetical protein
VIVTMEQTRPTRVDMSRRYALSDTARVICRSTDSVQIGIDEPRCVVVHQAPSETPSVLAALDGARTVAAVLTSHDADPVLWRALLDQLLAIELLVPTESAEPGPTFTPGAHLSDERSGLVLRHGHAAATRILQARDDALVVLRGSGVLAAPVATLLAASGVGHIHHEPTRPTPWTLATTPPPPPAPVRGAGRARGEVAAELLRTHPTVRVHPPAAHQHPTIVLLAGDPVPDLGVAASLVRSRVPHLAMTTGIARSVVGPLVLPGRSSCLSCAHRRRTDADPDWPNVARTLAGERTRASALVTSAAAHLAAGQLLEHIDGAACPQTVNGTLEWRAGDPVPRRRTWDLHPDCGCRGLSARG